MGGLLAPADVPGLAASGPAAFVGGSRLAPNRTPVGLRGAGRSVERAGDEEGRLAGALPFAAAVVAAAAGAARGRRTARRAVAGEKKEKKKVSVKRELQKLFIQAQKKVFAPNAWYESPDTTTQSKNNVWDYWQIRPNRTIDKICDGRERAGCTWTQLDGRRGASFIRVNDDGKVTYVREVAEPPSWSKFKENNMSSLKPVFGVMEGIKGFFNMNDQWLQVEEKDREPPKPRLGLAKPKTRRAIDVVQYLWEEAQYDPDDVEAVERVLAEYADDAVIEDLTYAEEAFKGIDAIRKYQEETKMNAPKGLRWCVDEISEGSSSCVCIWHIEYAGKRSPRGVSFYELDEEGKVKYVRIAYDLSF